MFLSGKRLPLALVSASAGAAFLHEPALAGPRTTGPGRDSPPTGMGVATPPSASPKGSSMRTGRRRMTLIATTAAATATLVAAGLLTAVSAQAAAGCQVAYSVASQWPGGFTGNVTVTNLGDPVSGWTLRWSFGAGQTGQPGVGRHRLAERRHGLRDQRRLQRQPGDQRQRLVRLQRALEQLQQPGSDQLQPQQRRLHRQHQRPTTPGPPTTTPADRRALPAAQRPASRPAWSAGPPRTAAPPAAATPPRPPSPAPRR